MTITDPQYLFGFAAMLTAIAAVIWALRRRP
jgi:hypothetical protein